MASTPKLIFLSFLVFISLCDAAVSSKPKALVLSVSKDSATLQYVTKLSVGTPLVEKSLVVDVGGQHFWMKCNEGYDSSTFRPSPCGSAACSVANTRGCITRCNPNLDISPRCHNNTCYVVSVETVHGKTEVGEISRDTIALRSTDGTKAGPQVTIPNFIFACANAWDISNLASGTKGMLGLGRFAIGMPMQLSSSFGGSFRRKFAICLPTSSESDGVIFFGDTPYLFYTNYNASEFVDLSSRFTHTRLYPNTILGSDIQIRGAPSPDHFVKVTSILVNQKPIPIDTKLLEFHRNGKGGTKISTVVPYTTLERSIFQALVKAFDEGIAVDNATKVAPVAPFTECYATSSVPMMSGLGLMVPAITFVFENKNVQWKLYGVNSVVEIRHGLSCLAFLDGGEAPIPTTPIVIGAYQLQDHLLEFDLASSRMSFTHTLQLPDSQCSNIKL
ncbi:hypothetical protein K2173_021191 [Erythroxylum novogranatense]|uniref:Peptidase A1 domain-containing protein n=1 Tax=Erythroxylum novogranatense TaxID=1862640 RepID=A0AAV8TMV2_9ROSI|nr:hypothetical protein K2173_021191 [Erythroxylum novogranatense]